MDLEILRERFASKWRKDRSGCWVWTASTAGAGYGQIKIPRTRRQIYAHRLSHLLHIGAIPAGMDVLHSCDTPYCVNPDHLFLGSPATNAADMSKKGRGTRARKMPQHQGARNSQAKLTVRDVREARRLLALGLSQRAIGRVLGVTGVQIGHIAHGRSWSHLQ